MRDWLVRIIILALLAVILGVPFLLRPAQNAGAAAQSPANPDDRLIILSPHNEQIRYEFAQGFNRYRVAQHQGPVQFDWRSSGGTSDLRKQVIAEYQSAAEHGADPPGYDLFFGGGDLEHNTLDRGIVVHQDGKDIQQSLTAPIDIPPDLLKQVFPQSTIGGVRLYAADMHWVGVVVSSFGIVYNRDVLATLNLTEPTTWADLGDGRYRQNIALADPAHSGSVAVAYDTVLRRLGWKEGWATLRRVYANARYFTSSAPKVPVDVSAGQAAAGMCIDFFGRYQVGAVGADRLGYVDPQFMTTVTPDPISILRGASHAQLARQFVFWLLAPEGQRLWQTRVGQPGGPERYELRRQPIRRDMYTPAEMAHWSDDVNPFNVARPLAPGMPDFYGPVAIVSHAMAIDILDDLRAARAAITDHPDHPRHEEMVALFDSMPEELTLTWPDPNLANNWAKILGDETHPRHTEAAAVLKGFIDGLAKRYNGWKDGEKMLDDRLRWTRFFQGNYRQIVAMAGEQ